MLSSARSKTVVRVAAAAVALTVPLSLTACGASSTNSGSAGKQLTIGFALSQSGDMAPFDVEPGKAALLRVKQINADGGINGKKIKTIVKDVRSDPDTVGTVTTQLISEGVNLVVLPCDFDLSAQGATAAQAAKIPAISICAGDPKMADDKTLGDYVFTANAGSDIEGSAGAAWAASKGWKKAFVLQDQSIEYTKSAGAYFEAAWKKAGGTIVGEGAFPGGDNVDVSSQISRIKALTTKPDLIYVASWNPGGATAIRQLREAGITTPVVGPAALDGKSLTDVVGNQASNIYYTAFACYVYCSGAKSTGLTSFVSSYKSAYGSAPSSSYALLGYDMVTAIADAADRASSFSGSALRNALQNGRPVDTPIGKVTYFSPKCHKIVDFPMSVISVSNGTMHFVAQQRVTSVPDIGDGNSCAS